MHRAVLLALGVLALSSCSDMEAGGKRARASHNAGIGFHRIAAEAPASCERATACVLAAQQPPDCSALQRLERPMTRINDALFAYLGALGNLARADTAQVTSG